MLTLQRGMCNANPLLFGFAVTTIPIVLNSQLLYFCFSRLKALYDLNETEETLARLVQKEKEMKQKNNEVDQQVSVLMRENQQLEAQKANLEHALANIDEDISVKQNNLDSQTKQIQKIENETIPPIEAEMTSLADQMTLLREEMGTELSDTISDDEKNLLQQLKVVLNELDTEIESQVQVLENVSVDRQRLMSLLEDNLMKRKQELEEEGTTSSSRRRSGGGQSASMIAQKERQVDLEQLNRELDEAVRNAEDAEERLADAKKLDETLYSELCEAKKQLDDLRAQDVQNMKQLEDARKREEKLMNKVRVYLNQ